MGKFIDEFWSLFAQLERMGHKTKIPESHKAPLLLASLESASQLGITVAALRTKDADEHTCKTVASDLTEEWNHFKSIQSFRERNRNWLNP